MTNQRSQDEEVLIDLRRTIFGNSGLANHAPVIFLADVMRWPARHWVLCIDDDRAGFQVAWINNHVIGIVSVDTNADTPFEASVHPLGTIERVELAGKAVSDFSKVRVARTVTVHFAGSSISIHNAAQDEQLEDFAEAVLATLSREVDFSDSNPPPGDTR